MRGFDKHLREILEAHPEAALEYAKLFAGLPLPTQFAMMRRRRNLSRKWHRNSLIKVFEEDQGVQQAAQE